MWEWLFGKDKKGSRSGKCRCCRDVDGLECPAKRGRLVKHALYAKVCALARTVRAAVAINVIMMKIPLA